MSDVIANWVKDNRIRTVSITSSKQLCVLDFMSSALSARNTAFLVPWRMWLCHLVAVLLLTFPFMHQEVLKVLRLISRIEGCMHEKIDGFCLFCFDPKMKDLKGTRVRLSECSSWVFILSPGPDIPYSSLSFTSIFSTSSCRVLDSL